MFFDARLLCTLVSFLRSFHVRQQTHDLRGLNSFALRKGHSPMVDLCNSRSFSRQKLVWCVIIPFVLSMTALGQTPQLILGTRIVQASLDNDNSEMAEAFPVTATSSGQINTLSVFLDGTNTAATVWVGLYTNNSGHPGQLLSQAVIQQPLSGNWNSVTIPAARVTAGKRYWMALLGVNGQIAFRDSSGNCNSETSQQTTLTSLPATWQIGSRWPTCTLSMFGSGGAPSNMLVTVSPTTASLQAGQQKQFTSTVNGTTNTAATWTASGGTITSAGLYTAPSLGGTYTITATSAADSSESASAVVTVSQPTQVSISVSPGTASLQSGTQQQFVATVSGSSNTTVSWSASGGTVTSSGLYLAPSAAGTYTVTATSAADSTKSASAVVTVPQPAQVSISVSPGTASLQSGAQQQFVASVSGSSNTAVAWSASGGTVTASGLYVAPSAAGTYTVTATSAADSTKSASAVVTVPQPVAISVSPGTASLQSGAQQQFIASVSGRSNTYRDLVRIWWHSHDQRPVRCSERGRHLHRDGDQRSRFNQISLCGCHSIAAHAGLDFSFPRHSQSSKRRPATVCGPRLGDQQYGSDLVGIWWHSHDQRPVCCSHRGGNLRGNRG